MRGMTRTASAPAPAQSTIEVAPLTLLAAVQSSTINAEARTVDVVFYAGGTIGWWEPRTGARCTITLALEPSAVRLGRLNGGAPLLDSHSAWSLASVLGVIEGGSARIEKGRGVATVRFSKREDVEPIWQDVRDGIIQNVSIGTFIHKYEITEPSDDRPMTCRALDWEPFEISAVPVGADPNAKIRAAADTTLKNPCVVVHAKETAMDDKDKAAATDKPVDSLPAAAAATATAASPAAGAASASGATAAELEAAAAAERQRIAAIQALGASESVKAAGVEAAFFDRHVKVGSSLEKVRTELLDRFVAAQAPREIAGQSDAATASVTADESDKWRRGATAWLLQRAGVAEKVRLAAQSARYGHHFKEVATDPGEFLGFSLLDLAKESLERQRIKTRGGNPMDIARAALRGGRFEQRGRGVVIAAGGLATPGEFAVLLENVMHKTLLASYAIAPDTWRLFCSPGTVTDFRAHNRYRWGSLGALESLTATGEFRIKSVPDGEKESVIASTKGNIVGITRQAIVNDDMSVFSGLATALGRAAALSIEIDVYATLAANSGMGPLMNDGVTLFHANHNNVGSGSALGVAALDADRVVMGAQRDPSANEILDLRPAVLVLPQSLGGAARVINEAEYETDPVTTNATNRFMVPNRVRGLFRTIVDSPRLSGTRRYLFADPGASPVIEVSFLQGQQEPVLEQHEPFDYDGIRWRARFDYGVGAVDFRSAVTNAGAA